MLCNECGNSGINRDCKYALGKYACKVLSAIANDGFNIKYGHQIEECNNIDMTVATCEDQWTATVSIGDGSYIILGWYKQKRYIETVYFMDERIMRPLTDEDVDKLNSIFKIVR